MSVRRARLRSLAKINLDLRVLHRNPDGFHELRTVFQTISLADSIEVEYQASRRTQLSIEDRAEIPGNLILSAAAAALEAMRVHARVHFRLGKNIPMGGGLGGGSGNAAAVLLALPILAGKRLAMGTRMELASQLGSDVPFFLVGGTAAGLGRGGEIYSLPELKPDPLLLVSPGLHVATGPAYAALGRGLTFPESSRSINNFQAFVRALGVERSAGRASAFSANDFEPAVFRQYPELQIIQAKLWKLGAAGVRMTGSGSAMVGIFGSREQRDQARIVLEGDRVFRGYRVFPASLVSGAGYRRLWRRQLADHLVPDKNTWPPQSRYER